MSNEKSVDWVLTEIDEPFVQQHVFASNSGVRVVTTVDGKVVCDDIENHIDLREFPFMKVGKDD